jgi:hypothetical protein
VLGGRERLQGRDRGDELVIEGNRQGSRGVLEAAVERGTMLPLELPRATITPGCLPQTIDFARGSAARRWILPGEVRPTVTYRRLRWDSAAANKCLR